MGEDLAADEISIEDTMELIQEETGYLAEDLWVFHAGEHLLDQLKLRPNQSLVSRVQFVTACLLFHKYNFRIQRKKSV